MFDDTKDAEISRSDDVLRGLSEFHAPNLLDAHVERLWDRLPAQSKKRLECIAVSTGVGVTAQDHARLICAFEMIAEEEGTLESEAEFASLYLGSVSRLMALLERPGSRPGKSIAYEKPDSGVRTTGSRPKRLGSTGTNANAKKRSGSTGITCSRPKRPGSTGKDSSLSETAAQLALALDGEGVTLDDGSHVYRYMAACQSDGTVISELDVPTGITTRQALDFVGNLPKRDSTGRPYLGVFGYGLGYDICKWLEDIPDSQLFELFHAEDLQPKAKCGPYRLNLLGKCLQITNKKAAPGSKRTLVWDILKAFQATFVNALRAWKVGTEEDWKRIEAMKEMRGDFVNSDWSAVTAYCRDECRLLAMLVEKYVRAHCEAGIDLRGKYHGAGSTGDAFLKLMDADFKRCSHDIVDADLADYMRWKSAMSRSFFGGRAEISRLGVVTGPVYSYDIGSAYPHALYDLPCMKHGKWKHVKTSVLRTARSSRLACIHYLVEPDVETKMEVEGEDVEKVYKRMTVMDVQGGPATLAWGSLPYRTEHGSIVFPATGPGGWSWLPEYEAAQKDWPGIVARDAWCLQSECNCERPYRQIGEYYLKRLDWGKEGPGLVLKLGLNSCYGKFAQVIGRNPRYACRVVAGMITATTRGRILEAIASADDPWSVIYVATDGIITDSHIAPPDPRENETKPGATKKGKVMLGAWETPQTTEGNTHPDDHFFVQPGFYFSTKTKGKAKTRGMPLKIVDQERGRILEQWNRAPLEPPKGLPKRSVFRGIKTSILRPSKEHDGYRRKPCYGRWEEEDRELKYVINPKRSHAERLPTERPAFRLRTWWLKQNQPESAEYAKDKGHDRARESLDEQPDFVETPGTNVGD
jgi:hypothetical protein